MPISICNYMGITTWKGDKEIICLHLYTYKWQPIKMFSWRHTSISSFTNLIFWAGKETLLRFQIKQTHLSSVYKGTAFLKASTFIKNIQM